SLDRQDGEEIGRCVDVADAKRCAVVALIDDALALDVAERVDAEAERGRDRWCRGRRWCRGLGRFLSQRSIAAEHKNASRDEASQFHLVHVSMSLRTR